MVGLGVLGLSLALRQQVLITAKASCHSNELCSVVGCAGRSADPPCRGNRFEQVADLEWLVVVPHHKESSMGITGPVFKVPMGRLAYLVQKYEECARPQLLAQAGDDSGSSASAHAAREMFLTNAGVAFTGPTFYKWWKQLYQ